MVIKVNDLTKVYGGKDIFHNLSFSIVSGKRVGLLGSNGAGKTTLMNCIAGTDKEFNGTIEYPRNFKIAYLSQGLSLGSDRTLVGECLLYFSSILELRAKVKDIEFRIHNGNNDPVLQRKYGDMLHLIESQDGYSIENRVEKVLSGLGFTKDQMNQKIKTMSGGEQRRGLLGKILLSEADLILLDEPTNHLDIFAIKWLESFLKGYKGAILMVSHDRELLDSVVDEVIELENGTISYYGGNYQFYLEEKVKNLEKLEKGYILEQRQIKKEEEFISRNIAGQKTKQAKSRRKKLEKMDRIDYIYKQRDWSFHFTNNVSHRRDILTIDKLSKSYGENNIFNNISFKFEKGDKVGLIGRNGSGKTSLISAILASHGNNAIKLNNNIRTTYFSQGNLNLDESISVLDTVQSAKVNETEIRTYLGLFQFIGDDIFKSVSVLSGGEKTRLALLKIILSPCDFLILDEPTNHLDILTKEILSKALNEYKGTVLVVSHDRSFINYFASKILLIAFKKAYTFYGNYYDNEKEILRLTKGQDSIGTSIKKEDSKAKKKNINVYKIDRVEKLISDLEKKRSELTSLLADSSIYSNYVKLTQIQKDLTDVASLLESKYLEWEELHV